MYLLIIEIGFDFIDFLFYMLIFYNFVLNYENNNFKLDISYVLYNIYVVYNCLKIKLRYFKICKVCYE